MVRIGKTALLLALFLAVIPAVPAYAGTTNILAARAANAPADAGDRDVDADDENNRGRPEAVLLRANQTPLRALGGARHPVMLRALLCEASFIPFALSRRSVLREPRLRIGRSPVVVIHFPRPPPFYREIV